MRVDAQPRANTLAASTRILLCDWHCKDTHFFFMKVIELLYFSRELLRKMQEAGIRLEDYRYVDLYSDYTRMLERGGKVSYIVAVLSDRYSVSERKVYDLIKRFQSDCKTFAV